jgi:molybdopterin-guanine dinucleotide biosynthesis protein A
MKISILCGGKSSRMQSEKGLVLYKKKAFIEHIIEAVLPISNNIQLITNGNNYDYLKYNTVKDRIINKGPIGGIYTALANSEMELNLILSCDIPLISTEILLELIANHKSNFDATVFEDSNRIHPLIGIYSKNCLTILKEAIDENDLKMMHLLSKISLQKIYVEENKNNLFKNINSIAELNELNNNKYKIQ